MTQRTSIMLSALSGVLVVFSFPPFDYYLLSWVALVPLFISVSWKKPWHAFLLGTLSGFVYFMGAIFWIFNPLYFYGNIPFVLSVLIAILLCAYLGIYVGAFSLLFSRILGRSRFPALFVAPVLWVTVEFVRTYALTGFPWALLGYSQYKFLPLIQIADITGVYGISFLVVAINAAIFDVCIYWPKRHSQMPLFERWPMTVGLITLVIVIILVFFYGNLRLSAGEGGYNIRVAVIQGNFEQDRKWDIKFQKEIIDTYKSLSIKALSESPSLIVWPETAVPFIFNYDKPLTDDLTEFQKTLGIHLLFGGMTFKDVRDNKLRLSNSSVLLSPYGEILSVYDKIHLVPYGEYVPLRNLLPFINKLTVGIGDFLPGDKYTVMQTPFAKIGNLICYEIIFPGMVRKFAAQGADMLVTITNDAWFGSWGAPQQHFSMAALRAVENRVPVIRAANTGISGFINAKGMIQGKSDIFVRTILAEDITVGIFKGSFYSKYGDLFAFFCIISSVLLIANNMVATKN